MEEIQKPSNLQFSVTRHFSHQFQGFKKSQYAAVSTSNIGPNTNSSQGEPPLLHRDSFGSLSHQINSQPWKGSMQFPVHNRPRYISETGTEATLLSTCTLDSVGRKDTNNNGDLDFPRYSDQQYEDPHYGNRSFSLLRNVYAERKASIQITILLILLGFTAAVGTVFVLSVVENGTTSNDVFDISDDSQLLLAGFDNFPIETATSAPKNPVSNSLALKGSKSNHGVRIDPMFMNMDPLNKAITRAPVPRTTRAKRGVGTPGKQTISYYKIASAIDFKKLEATTNTVEAIMIEKLVDEIHVSESNDNDAALEQYELEYARNVKHLNVAGPITEEWLQSILRTFDQVEHLTINVDQLCIGATVRDRQSLKPITLANVQRLHIENSHLCTISSWIFRWEAPKIRHLKIHNADLTKRTFPPVHDFLEKFKGSLISVIVSNSFICAECSIMDISYANMENIKILNEVEDPL